MNEDDIKKDLNQLCEHKEYIYKLFGQEIRRMTFLSMKYKEESMYNEVIRIKKTYNIIRHILHNCSKFSSDSE